MLSRGYEMSAGPGWEIFFPFFCLHFFIYPTKRHENFFSMDFGSRTKENGVTGVLATLTENTVNCCPNTHNSNKIHS